MFLSYNEVKLKKELSLTLFIGDSNSLCYSQILVCATTTTLRHRFFDDDGFNGVFLIPTI